MLSCPFAGWDGSQVLEVTVGGSHGSRLRWGKRLQKQVVQADFFYHLIATSLQNGFSTIGAVLSGGTEDQNWSSSSKQNCIYGFRITYW